MINDIAQQSGPPEYYILETLISHIFIKNQDLPFLTVWVRKSNTANSVAV